MIRETPRGALDVEHLRELLQGEDSPYRSRALKIGSFSAASNVTGVLAPVDEVTVLLHRCGALAMWDYATAGPYEKIDVNPVCSGPAPRSSSTSTTAVATAAAAAAAGEDAMELDSTSATEEKEKEKRVAAARARYADRAFLYKDAVFLSPHKMLGGPGAPGVLVAKKRLFANAVPTAPGGGTVFYVTDAGHRYLSNREERGEGGTPNIVGAVRAGLAFHLKDTIGHAAVEARERAVAAAVMRRLCACERVVVLGARDTEAVPRLPIFSFLVRAPEVFVAASADGASSGGFLISSP